VLVVLLLGAFDWPQYLGDPGHSSVALDAGITLAAAPKLVPKWRWALPAVSGRPHQILATPATFHGRVFVAATSGYFYALNESTGKQLWQRDFGVEPAKTCPDAEGIIASPAVRDDGHGNPLVYVYPPDGYLYELDGRTGKTMWRSLVQIASPTANDVYPWSSPQLYGGRVYVGISSNCDVPFTRGAVKSYDQATGKPIATGWMMPPGYAGSGVWTSPAVSADGLYVTTGSTYANTQVSHPPTVKNTFNQYSIVKLNPVTLAQTGKWPAPPTTLGDPDFASSPVLFSATIGGKQVPMVGACQKTGQFFALRRDTMKLVWEYQVGQGSEEGQTACDSGGVWDGHRLFVGGDGTTIGSTTYAGSVRQLDPASGKAIWQTGLSATPLGSGTINGASPPILAYAGTDWTAATGNFVYLINPATGHMVNELYDYGQSAEFAQPVWVDGKLLMTNVNAVLAWAP
jgi:polyvinyl alcohol dehydrogenase (cytochrome)